jgi:hypothetical protein
LTVGGRTEAGKEPPNQRLRTLVRGTGEILLFGFSLAIAIPPIPSDAGQVYSPAPAMWVGGAAFGAFLLLSRKSIPLGIGLMLVYLIFVYTVNLRVFA